MMEESDDDFDDIDGPPTAAMSSPSSSAAGASPVGAGGGGVPVSTVAAELGLEFYPSHVEIVTARVDGSYTNPAYIMKCSTPSNDVWAVARRFKQFKALRDELVGKGNGKTPDAAIMSVPFPDKVEALLGKASADSTETRQRQVLLQKWLNTVIGMSPGHTAIVTFLARDSSVSSPLFLAWHNAHTTMPRLWGEGGGGGLRRRGGGCIQGWG
jgi:hypothetical protein